MATGMGRRADPSDPQGYQKITAENGDDDIAVDILSLVIAIKERRKGL